MLITYYACKYSWNNDVFIFVASMNCNKSISEFRCSNSMFKFFGKKAWPNAIMQNICSTIPMENENHNDASINILCFSLSASFFPSLPCFSSFCLAFSLALVLPRLLPLRAHMDLRSAAKYGRAKDYSMAGYCSCIYANDNKWTNPVLKWNDVYPHRPKIHSL